VHGRHLARQVGERGERPRCRPAVLDGDDFDAAAAGDGQPAPVGRPGDGRDRLDARIRSERRHGECLEDRTVLCRPRGARRDPGLERGEVGRGHLRLVGRRHVIGVGALDPLNEHRRGGVAGHDRVAGAVAPLPQRREPLDGEPRLRVAVVVAARAIGPQDRRDLAVIRRRSEARHGRKHRNRNESCDARRHLNA
jgi:hypothetical protein